VSGEGNRGGSWQLLKGKRKGGGAAFVPVLRKWPESVERCGDMCQCLVVVASSFDLKEEDTRGGPMMGLEAE
jgi:hypothetical protein